MFETPERARDALEFVRKRRSMRNGEATVFFDL
jgi:hypothetical protein